jgi:hypothetical protein
VLSGNENLRGNVAKKREEKEKERKFDVRLLVNEKKRKIYII